MKNLLLLFLFLLNPFNVWALNVDSNSSASEYKVKLSSVWIRSFTVPIAPSSLCDTEQNIKISTQGDSIYYEYLKLDPAMADSELNRYISYHNGTNRRTVSNGIASYNSSVPGGEASGSLIGEVDVFNSVWLYSPFKKLLPEPEIPDLESCESAPILVTMGHEYSSIELSESSLESYPNIKKAIDKCFFEHNSVSSGFCDIPITIKDDISGYTLRGGVKTNIKEEITTPAIIQVKLFPREIKVITPDVHEITLNQQERNTEIESNISLLSPIAGRLSANIVGVNQDMITDIVLDGKSLLYSNYNIEGSNLYQSGNPVIRIELPENTEAGEYNININYTLEVF